MKLALCLSILATSMAAATQPAPQASPESPPKEPTSMFASLNDHKVHYVDSAPASETKGEEAIVLIHGWASDWTLLRHQYNNLQSRARVIAIDLPGHGKSDAPEIEYTMDLFADAIAAVLDQAGIERAVLVGHSNGVPTIRQFYRRFPHRTLALVCLDGALLSVFPETMNDLMVTALSKDNYLQTIDAMTTPMLAQSPLDDDQKGHIKQVIHSTPRHVLLGTFQASADPKIWIDDAIDIPTLVINTKNPTIWTDDYLANIKALGPDIEIHTWPGVSHMLMMEKPEKLRQEINEFLEGHELLR